MSGNRFMANQSPRMKTMPKENGGVFSHFPSSENGTKISVDSFRLREIYKSHVKMTTLAVCLKIISFKFELSFLERSA